MSLKMPPERMMYSDGGAPGSREVMTPHLRRTDLAEVDGGLHSHEVRIEPPVKPDHKSGSSLINHVQTGTNLHRVKVNWLFTENGLASTRELFNLL